MALNRAAVLASLPAVPGSDGRWWPVAGGKRCRDLGPACPGLVPGLPVGQVLPKRARGRGPGGAPDALNDLAPCPWGATPPVAGGEPCALQPPRRSPGVRAGERPGVFQWLGTRESWRPSWLTDPPRSTRRHRRPARRASRDDQSAPCDALGRQRPVRRHKRGCRCHRRQAPRTSWLELAWWSRAPRTRCSTESGRSIEPD
jgi:hypothetical protein